MSAAEQTPAADRAASALPTGSSPEDQADRGVSVDEASRRLPERHDFASLPGAGHRERLLAAMADSIREHGYRGTTVADIVRRARTSRRTFYQHFDDREACFLALDDELNAVLSGRIAQALQPDATWEQQVDQAIGAYIDEVELEPELTIAFTRELTALGEVGTARQRQELDKFADLLIALVAAVAASNPAVKPVEKTTAIMITGGLRELLAYAVENDIPVQSLKPTASGLIKSILDPAHQRFAGPGAG